MNTEAIVNKLNMTTIKGSRCDLPDPGATFNIIYGRLTRWSLFPDMMEYEAYISPLKFSYQKLFTWNLIKSLDLMSGYRKYGGIEIG